MWRRNLLTYPTPPSSSSSTWPLSHTFPPSCIIPMMSSPPSSMSSWTPHWRIATTSPAALVRLKTGTRLEVRRGNHVVPETDSLTRTALWARRPGGGAPSWSKGGTAKGIDPAQTLGPWLARRSIPLVPRWHGGREQLDPAGTSCTSSAASRPATPLITETMCLCSRSGAVGSLGWCCRSMGQCLTALLSQEVQKKWDEFVFVNSDLRFAECQAVFFLETITKKLEVREQITLLSQ